LKKTTFFITSIFIMFIGVFFFMTGCFGPSSDKLSFSFGGEDIIDTPSKEQQKEESKPVEDIKEAQAPESKNVTESPESPPESQKGLTLPEGWPLPFNTEIILEFSTTRNGDDYIVWEIVGIYPGKGKEIYEWYKSKLGGFIVDVDQVYDKGNNVKGYEYRISSDIYKALLAFEDTSDNQSSVSIYIEKAFD